MIFEITDKQKFPILLSQAGWGISLLVFNHFKNYILENLKSNFSGSNENSKSK